jgi:hypothetical protein
MELKGGGCTQYKLGSGDHAASSGGGVGAALIVRQTYENDHIAVSVDDNGTPIVQRSYDRSFFEKTRVDEFTATSSTGAESLFLRYWGALGTEGCTPLTDVAPPSTP